MLELEITLHWSRLHIIMRMLHSSVTSSWTADAWTASQFGTEIPQWKSRQQISMTKFAVATFVSSNAQQDGCIVWNKHNRVFGSKAICVQAVYFLHSTCLVSRACDCIIYRVTYLQFPLEACFSSMSVRQVAQRRSWFTQYRTLPKISVGRFLV